MDLYFCFQSWNSQSEPFNMIFIWKCTSKSISSFLYTDKWQQHCSFICQRFLYSIILGTQTCQPKVVNVPFSNLNVNALIFKILKQNKCLEVNFSLIMDDVFKISCKNTDMHWYQLVLKLETHDYLQRNEKHYSTSARRTLILLSELFKRSI